MASLSNDVPHGGGGSLLAVRLGLVVALAAGATVAAPVAAGRAVVRSPYALANRCFALQATATARYVALSGSGTYTAGAARRAGAVPLYLKPTGLITYMLYDREGGLLAEARDAVTRTSMPGPPAEWRIARAPGSTFTLTSTADGRQLEASRWGSLTLDPPGSPGRAGRFAFPADRGCQAFPEAEVGAFGRARSSVSRNGTVFGWADLEFHQTASFRAGGDVIDGEDFDPFGITVALSAARDEQEHGPDGTLDVTGNLLRFGRPVGTTDTHGWPTFVGWPTFNTLTNQQAYWVWLERAWRSGMRLVVANTSEDEELCKLEPMRAHTCDEEGSIELQVQNLEQLQGYIDAQSGGPGRGFFRLVYSPGQARRVIEQGKLAVVVGVESSNPFGCREYEGQPRCTRADIDRGLTRWWRLGIRTFFPVHWVDNAFAGAALEGGATGTFLNLLNKYQTGHYFNVSSCPLPGEGEQMQSVGIYFPDKDLLSQTLDALQSAVVPTYPKGKVCNAKGLTRLGDYLVEQTIARHFMIMLDHVSESARESVLAIAARTQYPLISPHTDTGGAWVPQDFQRLYALGGLATVTPDVAPVDDRKILQLTRYRLPKYYFGVGFGTDTGGFGSLPGPAAAGHPLHYPFRAYNGVQFAPERTGERVYDLNKDGVAQYGLMPDLIAEMQQQPGGRAAIPVLYRSAEAYLEAWQRAWTHR